MSTKTQPAKRKPTRPSNNRTRQARAAQQSHATRWIIIGVVLVIVVAVVVAAVGGSGSSSSSGPLRSPAPAALVAQVTGVNDATINAVGAGTTTQGPQKITAPALTENGKPVVLYMGAEYCPYCAAERWAMVNALSRFGTFSNLQTTHSAVNDGNIQTFSFYGATYTSKYLAFQSVELETNTSKALETPNAEQSQLMTTYDAPPYTSQNGTIPFIDIGGKYLVNGASYDASVLSGKSADEIAAALSNPNSDIAKAVVGTANALTAAICKITNNQPASACANPAVAKIAAQL